MKFVYTEPTGERKVLPPKVSAKLFPLVICCKRRKNTVHRPIADVHVISCYFRSRVSLIHLYCQNLFGKKEGLSGIASHGQVCG